MNALLEFIFSCQENRQNNIKMNQKLIDYIKEYPGVTLVTPVFSDDGKLAVDIEFEPTDSERLSYEQIAYRNYAATEKRGLINEKTTLFDFCGKINEELQELQDSIDYIPENGTYTRVFDASELADISLVCDSMAIHYGIDLMAEKQAKMYINETRKD